MATHRILIVDDSLDVRRMLGTSLRMMGSEFDVLEVPSAEEALLIGTRLPFDMMVADVRLPGMSGLDMLERLRKSSPDMKVILVTGVSDGKIRREVAEAGADAFFYKPIVMADFLDTTERLLGIVKDVFPLPPVGDEPITRSAKITAEGRIEETQVKPAHTLADHLVRLRYALNAISVLLIADRGQILAEAGESKGIKDNQALIAAITTTMSASNYVSQGLGVTTPDSLMFYGGVKHHLCLVPVGAYTLLLSLEDGYKDMQIAVMQMIIHQETFEIEKILSNIDAAAKSALETKEPTIKVAEVPLDPKTLAGLDEVFSSSKSIKEQDVDAFWDALSEQNEMDGSGNADALTYDQARQLGIAPDDE